MGAFGVMGVLRANAKKAHASLGVGCGESGWGDCHSFSFPKGVGGVVGRRGRLGVSWVSIEQGWGTGEPGMVLWVCWVREEVHGGLGDAFSGGADGAMVGADEVALSSE